MELNDLAFGVLMFVAVVLALEGLYLLWASRHSAEARRLAARLRYLEGAPPVAPAVLDLRHDAQGGWVSRTPLAQWLPWQRLERFAATSGTGRRAGELMLASAVLGAAATSAAVLFGLGLPAVLAAGAAAAALPWLWLSRRRGRRLRRLEQQLPLALDFMGRALRAGHTLPTAIKMVSEEMSDPMAREFRQVFDETNFGMPQSEALLRLAQRVPLEDVRFFAVAVMIQRESGGNLAELLDSLAAIVRARLKLLGQVRALSAEGRMSGWILGLLPFVTAALMNLLHPELMSTLWTDPLGLQLVAGALALMAFGGLWMRRVIRIRV